MNRVALLACFVALVGCGGATKGDTQTAHAAPAAPPPDAGAAPAEPPPEPVEPWPSTKAGAVWVVVEWKMTDREASEALAGAGFNPQARTDASGRVEALDVVSPLNGWKAQIAFDANTKQVDTVTVRGDPATIPQARAERAQLEERFGAPVETHVHWSKQCANDKAIEIEGPAPAWRFTQSLTRQGDAKTAVPWPSLESLTWGMPLSAVAPAMRSAGYVLDKLPPPPPPKKPAAGKAAGKPTGGKKTPKPPPPKKGPPPPPPKGGKLVEVLFKKGDQHVRLGVLEKAGLQSVGVGQDVADRKTAERRANDALGSLGSCLSEAETESSAFRDGTVDLELKITGFQGQRVVFESYRNPAADPAK